jgi:glycerophosphoryl diester phosphodiesterase
MKKITAIVAVLILNACTGTRTNKMKAAFTMNPVIAHRGAFKNNNLPENSIAALKAAIRLGCYGSEFDVRMTADDTLVINHDPYYKGLEIKTSSYGQLKALPLSNGEVIPTLRQFLLAGLSDNPHTKLILEIKPSPDKARGQRIATMVVNMVHEMHAGSIIHYISFDYEVLKKVRSLDSNAITQYLNGDKTPEQLKAVGIRGVDYNILVFKAHPLWIEKAKSLGLLLNTWTVNTDADMNWALDQGFDFITTNEPELLFETLKK